MLNHEFRRKGIGGSDVATILGISPWQSQLALYHYIKETGIATKDNSAMKYGREKEADILTQYEHDKDIPIERNQQIVDSSCEIFRGNVDGINRYKRVLVEAKTAFKRKGWGVKESDNIPIHYMAQCAYYAAIEDSEKVDIAVKFADTESIEYFIYNRNEKLEKGIRGKVLRWWENHIVEDHEPEPSCKSDYDDFVNVEIVDAPNHILSLYQDYKKLIPAAKEAKKIKEAIKKWANERCSGKMKVRFPDCSVLGVQSFKHNPDKIDAAAMQKDGLDVDKYTSKSRSLCFKLK